MEIRAVGRKTLQLCARDGDHGFEPFNWERSVSKGETAMWGYGYNMMGWSWVVGAVLIVLVIVAVIVVLRLVPGRAHHPLVNTQAVAGEVLTPRQILDERYAKGDLTTKEYLERVKHLGSA